MIHVWLAYDPETCRITMQDREFSDGSLPRGLRGLGWAFREGDIDADVYAAIMANELSGDEVDDIHRTLWTENGETPWPEP